jgi:hypothetical protein
VRTCSREGTIGEDKLEGEDMYKVRTCSRNGTTGEDKLEGEDIFEKQNYR